MMVWPRACRRVRLPIRAVAHAYQLLDRSRRNLRRLVLPDANDFPTVLLEPNHVSRVAPSVLLDLRTPVVRPGARSRAVLRTPVPEAAVNVDREPSAREDDVRPQEPLGTGSDREIDPETETTPVKRRP